MTFPGTLLRFPYEAKTGERFTASYLPRSVLPVCLRPVGLLDFQLLGPVLGVYITMDNLLKVNIDLAVILIFRIRI